MIVYLTVPVALPGYYGELTVKKSAETVSGKKKIFYFINIHKNMDVCNLQNHHSTLQRLIRKQRLMTFAGPFTASLQFGSKNNDKKINFIFTVLKLYGKTISMPNCLQINI